MFLLQVLAPHELEALSSCICLVNLLLLFVTPVAGDPFPLVRSAWASMFRFVLRPSSWVKILLVSLVVARSLVFHR